MRGFLHSFLVPNFTAHTFQEGVSGTPLLEIGAGYAVDVSGGNKYLIARQFFIYLYFMIFLKNLIK